MSPSRTRRSSFEPRLDRSLVAVAHRLPSASSSDWSLGRRWLAIRLAVHLGGPPPPSDAAAASAGLASSCSVPDSCTVSGTTSPLQVRIAAQRFFRPVFFLRERSALRPETVEPSPAVDAPLPDAADPLPDDLVVPGFVVPDGLAVPGFAVPGLVTPGFAVPGLAVPVVLAVPVAWRCRSLGRAGGLGRAGRLRRLSPRGRRLRGARWTGCRPDASSPGPAAGRASGRGCSASRSRRPSSPPPRSRSRRYTIRCCISVHVLFASQ